MREYKWAQTLSYIPVVGSLNSNKGSGTARSKKYIGYEERAQRFHALSESTQTPEAQKLFKPLSVGAFFFFCRTTQLAGS